MTWCCGWISPPRRRKSSAILSDTFHFHPLAVEDAVADVPHPKIEPYDGYVYLILHGIDFRAAQHRFATHDTDFFLGPNYLVTVHDGQTRTIQEMHEHVSAERPHPRRRGPSR